MHKLSLFWAILSCGLVLIIQVGCQATGGPGWGPSQSAGTVFGGASGGVIGAALGSHQGKTAEGALIGGVAGALLGNAVGAQADATDLAVQQASMQQYASDVRGAISHDQVIQMVQQGLSDEIIANQIHNQGVARRPAMSDLVYLKSQGVSDRVLAAMQSAWTPGETPRGRQAVPNPPSAVIVEDYGWMGPPVMYHVPHHHCYPGRWHRGTHWGLSIGL